MYIPQIKDKYSLVDLARYGTRARKHIHSDVLVGLHPAHPMFKEGDILDANATFNLIQCAYDQDRVYKILSRKIEDFEDTVNETVGQVKDTCEELSTKMDSYDADIQQAATTSQQAYNKAEEVSFDLQQTKQKHDRDIQETRQYIDDEIHGLNIRTVYDDQRENLFITLNNE